jgi:hypothetical protein
LINGNEIPFAPPVSSSLLTSSKTCSFQFEPYTPSSFTSEIIQPATGHLRARPSNVTSNGSEEEAPSTRTTKEWYLTLEATAPAQSQLPELVRSKHNRIEVRKQGQDVRRLKFNQQPFLRKSITAYCGFCISQPLALAEERTKCHNNEKKKKCKL